VGVAFFGTDELTSLAAAGLSGAQCNGPLITCLLDDTLVCHVTAFHTVLCVFENNAVTALSFPGLVEVNSANTTTGRPGAVGYGIYIQSNAALQGVSFPLLQRVVAGGTANVFTSGVLVVDNAALQTMSFPVLEQIVLWPGGTGVDTACVAVSNNAILEVIEFPALQRVQCVGSDGLFITANVAVRRVLFPALQWIEASGGNNVDGAFVNNYPSPALVEVSFPALVNVTATNYAVFINQIPNGTCVSLASLSNAARPSSVQALEPNAYVLTRKSLKLSNAIALNATFCPQRCNTLTDAAESASLQATGLSQADCNGPLITCLVDNESGVCHVVAFNTALAVVNNNTISSLSFPGLVEVNSANTTTGVLGTVGSGLYISNNKALASISFPRLQRVVAGGTSSASQGYTAGVFLANNAALQTLEVPQLSEVVLWPGRGSNSACVVLMNNAVVDMVEFPALQRLQCVGSEGIFLYENGALLQALFPVLTTIEASGGNVNGVYVNSLALQELSLPALVNVADTSYAVWVYAAPGGVCVNVASLVHASPYSVRVMGLAPNAFVLSPISINAENLQNAVLLNVSVCPQRCSNLTDAAEIASLQATGLSQVDCNGPLITCLVDKESGVCHVSVFNTALAVTNNNAIMALSFPGLLEVNSANTTTGAPGTAGSGVCISNNNALVGISFPQLRRVVAGGTSSANIAGETDGV
jgi:hypothetical protein